jgi:Arc/MetJ family transcription regulator
MHTNIDIDEELLKEAMTLGHCRTKKAVVGEALSDYVQRLKQQQILELFGKIDFDSDYDHKELRQKR